MTDNDEYPKTLNVNETLMWCLNTKNPHKVGATQISDTILILRAVNEKNKNLTLKEEIALDKLGLLIKKV